MKIIIKQNKNDLGKVAAQIGAENIISTIVEKGSANIILATGASQFEMIDHLLKQNIEWGKVTCFHLDEYLGISDKHPASFRKYLKERFADYVSVKEFYYINGENDAGEECRKLNEIINKHDIDVAFIGIGENGHLAFNDPPADFETEQAYIIVELDHDCRLQQFNEGWFPTLESVPTRAISMSIKQILKSKTIICTVPDKRKANAVFNTVNDVISSDVPATILRNHVDTTLLLDNESASLLGPKI